MSDQVEMVAAEDAADNKAGAVETTSAQPEGQQPEAPVVAAAAEVSAAVEPVASEVAVEAAAGSTEAVPEAVAVPEVVSVPEVAPEAEVAAEESAESGKRGNVRILAVGQQVQGAVKRIADFGAFVDIGVGRDGLIHISELSVRRVGKVTDVLSEGQEITAWIKKLDRDRNRISLTLVDPNTKTIRDLEKGDVVQGTVTRILPYGAFVDIGIGRDALLHVREMSQGFVAKPEDVVKPGETIEARIIELSRRRGRVDLSLKGLREEPEPPAPAPSARTPEPEPEPEPEEIDEAEDIEVLSPMQLAFKRAMQAEGMEFEVDRKKQGKRKGRERSRSIQEDIISRTLNSGLK